METKKKKMGNHLCLGKRRRNRTASTVEKKREKKKLVCGEKGEHRILTKHAEPH